MATYVMLSRVSPEALENPEGLRQMASAVSDKIKADCPAVTWMQSYATMGRFDVVDIVESDDPKQVARAAMIIRCVGRSTTETLPATPWKDFLEAL